MALHNIVMIITGLSFNGIAKMQHLILLLVINYSYSIELLLNYVYIQVKNKMSYLW